MTALAAALLALAAPLVQGDGIEREFALRVQALSEPSARLLRELEHADWRRRAAALDALERGLSSGGPADEVACARIAQALADPHPSARAAALRAAASAGRALTLDAEAVARLAKDVLPAVRLELVRALPRTRGEGRPEVLERLVADDDPRVHDAALAVLFALDDGAVVAAARARVLATLDPGAVVRALEVLSRGTPFPATLTALRALAPIPRTRVLLEAAALRSDGEGDVALLADGWIDAADGDARATALLVAAGEPGNAALGRALLAQLAALDASGVEDAPRFELVEAALVALGGESLARAALEHELAPATDELVLAELGRQLAGWGPATGRRWLARAPEATVPALATTLARTNDDAAGELLVGALEVAGVERLAFRALADAERPRRPWLEALFDAWVVLAPEGRAERLAWLRRDVRLTPFRGELLAFGDAGGEGRRQAVELLAAFSGDAEVRARVERWLTEELDALHRGDRSREAEQRAKGCLRTLAHVDPRAAAAALAKACESSLGVSIEVGKTAAWALARSAEGRERLERFLGPDVESRTRIEAGIGLVSHGRAGVLEILMDDYARAAWDLRGRILRAIGKAPGASAVAFLRSAALDEGHDGEQRLAAVEALAARAPDDDVVAALVAAASASPEFEARRAAVAALGRIDDERAVAAVSRIALAPHDPVDEEAALLAREALVAWALARTLPLERARAVVARPLAAAGAELTARFREEPLARPAFRYRSELDLAARLAWQGQLPAALGPVEDWTRLDARLLAALSRSAADDPTVARTLARAALIGLAGEPRGDAALAFELRARLLAHAFAERTPAGCAAAARLARELGLQARLGEAPRAALASAFGVHERERSIDPLARLAALALQADAWHALVLGHRDEAAALARAAAERVGNSALARAEQARLVGALR